jgi:hypothetical protein
LRTAFSAAPRFSSGRLKNACRRACRSANSCFQGQKGR